MSIDSIKNSLRRTLKKSSIILKTIHQIKITLLKIPLLNRVIIKAENMIYCLMYGEEHLHDKFFRINIINNIIKKTKSQVYLEVGVSKGLCFNNIKIKKKIAVDPSFSFSSWNKMISALSFKRKLYKMTSEEFFKKKKKLIAKTGLDVVFLDGLHTYKQTLKDTLNSLDYLNENGIIILHDCNPENEMVAYPAKSQEHYVSLKISNGSKLWTGDVWKTIPYLRAVRKDLSIFVLDCDFGLGIITKTGSNKDFPYSLKKVEKFTYKDLEKDRTKILNLKAPEYFYEFLKEL